MVEFIINSAWFLSLLAEIVIIVFLERRWWGSYFTPTTALSIPYLIIVVLAMCTGGHFGFVPFYYPSLLIWIIGLALMEITSGVCAVIRKRIANDTTIQIHPMRHEFLFVVFLLMLLALFIIRFRSALSHSAFAFGSDDFGEEFATFGLFGHLMTLLLACLIVCFGLIRNGRRMLYLGIIVLTLFFLFVNQVKSWVLIPLAAGILLCLVTGKSHLTIRLVLLVIVGGLGLFSLSYLFIFMIALDKEYSPEIGAIIYEHIVHYLLSGVMGYSEILRQDLIDAPNAAALFSPFINLWNALTGQATISPTNPHFLVINQHQTLGSNIRTLFGTIYIYGGSIVFVLYTIAMGFICYLSRIISIRSHSLYLVACDAWFCALLAMGWFECYTFHLRTIEVPLILLLFYFASCARWGRKEEKC